MAAYSAGKKNRKLSVLTWCSPWNLQSVWAVMSNVGSYLDENSWCRWRAESYIEIVDIDWWFSTNHHIELDALIVRRRILSFYVFTYYAWAPHVDWDYHIHHYHHHHNQHHHHHILMKTVFLHAVNFTLITIALTILHRGAECAVSLNL